MTLLVLSIPCKTSNISPKGYRDVHMETRDLKLAERETMQGNSLIYWGNWSQTTKEIHFLNYGFQAWTKQFSSAGNKSTTFYRLWYWPTMLIASPPSLLEHLVDLARWILIPSHLAEFSRQEHIIFIMCIFICIYRYGLCIIYICISRLV
jgi:hypothetical protein